LSRVLLVEDEEAIAELLAVNLRHEGYDVSIAIDAAQARDMVSHGLPDAVVLDWVLPDEPGVALLREWRANERTCHLPIMILSAHASEAHKIEGLDAGADGYMTKPFSLQELLADVRSLLRRTRTSASAASTTRKQSD
jgi:two-component system phosphate regulon response regulator PhoB